MLRPYNDQLFLIIHPEDLNVLAAADRVVTPDHHPERKIQHQRDNQPGDKRAYESPYHCPHQRQHQHDNHQPRHQAPLAHLGALNKKNDESHKQAESDNRSRIHTFFFQVPILLILHPLYSAEVGIR